MKQAALALLALLSHGCSTERCDDLSARPLEGQYVLDEPATYDEPEETLSSGSLSVSAGLVTVTYERLDGTRYRIKYRVKQTRVER